MEIVKAEIDHLDQVMRWFPDEKSARTWAGPQFRYPYSDQSLLEDLRWEEWHSFVLQDESHVVVAFGQIFEKYERIHLARLVVGPERRGEGLGRKLISDLIREGPSIIRREEFSLNVYLDNPIAINCYRSFGFVARKSPETHEGFSNCLFMVLEKS